LSVTWHPIPFHETFNEDIKYKTMTKWGFTCRDSSGLHRHTQGGYYGRNTAYGWLYHCPNLW